MALLYERGHVGHIGAALGTGRCQHAQFSSGLVLTQDTLGQHQGSDLPAHQIHQRLRATGVRHVLPRHARFLEQHHLQQMQQGARTGGADVGKPWVGAHPVQQFTHVAHALGYRWPHREPQRGFCRDGHRLHIDRRIIRLLGIQIRVDRGKRAWGKEHDRAIDWPRLQRVERHQPRRAGAVVHNGTFGVAGTELLGHLARHGVRDAASGCGTENLQLLDGSLRVGAGSKAKSHDRSQGRGCLQKFAAACRVVRHIKSS